MKTKYISLFFSGAALLMALAIPSDARAQMALPAGSTVPELKIPDAQQPVAAQPSDGNPQATSSAAGANSYGMTLSEAWNKGGILMWVLLFVSMMMVSEVIYLFCIIRQGAVVPRRLINNVRNFIVEGDYNSARTVCEDRPCPFSAIVLTALDCLRATGADDRQLLRDVVESEGGRQAESMQSKTQVLLDLSAIAPMLGLLGTTLGMLKAFSGVATDLSVAAKPVILAQGVSEAIITTIFGLVVAIPCMGFYAYFRRRTSRMTGLLEMSAAEIITALSVRRDAAAPVDSEHKR